MQSATPSGQKHEREESNPVRRFWRPLALPGAHSCIAVVHSKDRQGIRRESNPYLLVHSQACSDRYTTDLLEASRPAVNQRRMSVKNIVATKSLTKL